GNRARDARGERKPAACGRGGRRRAQGDPSRLDTRRGPCRGRRRHGGPARADPPAHGTGPPPAALRRRYPRRHRQRPRRHARRADRRPRRGLRRATRRGRVARGGCFRHSRRRADPAAAGPFREAAVMLDLIGYGAFFMSMALTYAIMCLGLNVQWGQTGLFNVGVAGFVAIGAYVSALLTTPDAADRFGGFGLPIVVGWAGGALTVGLVTFLVAALTMRLRADYLAIATFGVAVAVQLCLLNLEGLTG